MRIGVDLGGTKIEIIALGSGGVTLARRRTPTPRDDYRAIVATIAGLVDAVETETGRKGSLGVGIPGAMSPATGLVKNANTVVLIGEPLDKDLSQATGRPVRIDNDANCFALSEAVDGAAAGLDVVFGAILGTGCGAGIAIQGRPVTGRHRIAGEWGHNPLPRMTETEMSEAPACYCGRRGCLETWISGTGFAEDHFRATGDRREGPAIVAAMAEGDAQALASYSRLVDRMGRAFGGIVNVLDPDAIVLGGGLGGIDRLYRDLPEATRPHVFSDAFTTPFLKPKHGDSSGVRGAAWLWGEEEAVS